MLFSKSLRIHNYQVVMHHVIPHLEVTYWVLRMVDCLEETGCGITAMKIYRGKQGVCSKAGLVMASPFLSYLCCDPTMEQGLLSNSTRLT